DARVEASTVAEVYFLAPFNGNAGFFSFADLPGRLTLSGISGLFQDLRLSRLFATDFDGNDLELSNLGQNPLIGAYVSLEGDVRVVVLTGSEKQPNDFLTALNNSILNGTPLDLSGNVLSVDSPEVLQMITDLILIDVDGVED
ncbi:MAG: hypothetical protein P1U89_27780, partial [Verrucomicrobiales bacterium]|nr:hypothetical protein [Verrucomicrobiales bacterium]